MELKDPIDQLKFEIKKGIVAVAVMVFFVIVDCMTAWANVLRDAGGGWIAFNIFAAVVCAWCAIELIKQILRYKKEIKRSEEIIKNDKPPEIIIQEGN
jgi:cellobiose-specific phosphotransferase system component IIC